MSFEIMKIGKGKSETVVVNSVDVAKAFGKEHGHVMRDIRDLNCSETFRASNFGLSSYQTDQNKKQPMYYMTRDGFVLLVMGYRGEKATRFKEAYIAQFNSMEKALQAKLIERAKSIAVRNSLMETLKLSNENERMHGHAYPVYTNFVYKTLFGKSAKKLREDFGISDTDNLRDHFPPEELSKIEAMENLVSGLVNVGMGYNEIKDFISKNKVKMIV